MKRQICGESNAAHLTAKVLYDDDGYFGLAMPTQVERYPEDDKSCTIDLLSGYEVIDAHVLFHRNAPGNEVVLKFDPIASGSWRAVIEWEESGVYPFSIRVHLMNKVVLAMDPILIVDRIEGYFTIKHIV